MQILFWMPTVLTILLILLFRHGYRQNLEYRRRNMKTHQELQSVKYRLDNINEDQQNEAMRRKETEAKLRGYLTIPDTLINTIPNPIYFKDESRSISRLQQNLCQAYSGHIPRRNHWTKIPGLNRPDSLGAGGSLSTE